MRRFVKPIEACRKRFSPARLFDEAMTAITGFMIFDFDAALSCTPEMCVASR